MGNRFPSSDTGLSNIPARITLRDVARAADVSVTTASRVLSGSRPVQKDLAAKVRAIADDLGYRTHHTAKALRSQRTSTVGMVVPQVANPFFPTLVQAVERRLHHHHDLALMLCDSQDHPEREAERLDALVERQVDGLVVIPSHIEASSTAVRHAATRVPLVQVDRWAADADADVVSIDHAHGIALAVDHLVAIGRERIAVIGATQTGAAARERAHAARRRILDHGAHLAAMLEGSYTIEFGEQAGATAVARNPIPDAIVCGNDLIALGVMRALTNHGIAVPGDIAVTGFDGIIFAGVSTPRLTTVTQPVEAIAAAVAARLLARMQGDTQPARHERLEGHLLVRGSTGGEPT